MAQLYGEYLGELGSLTIVSLQHYFCDVLLLMASLGTLSLWACNIHFRGRLCPAISLAGTLYLSLSVGVHTAAIVVVLSLELYQPTFGTRAHKGDLSMPADDYCL